MFMFCRCVIVLIVVFVCRVDNIRWLVKLVWIVIFVVIKFWIFLIIIIFGFWCNIVCNFCVNVILILVLIWVWLMFFNWYLIGFLIVSMLCELLLSCVSLVYSVVVLLELVGLVIRIMLWGLVMMEVMCLRLLFVILRCVRLRWLVCLFSKWSIICLLVLFGIVEIWIFILWLFILSEIWLFWGIFFLVMFNFVIIFIWDISKGVNCCLGCMILCRMSFIWKCIISCFLKVLIWILEVFILIVLVNSVLIKWIIGVLFFCFIRFFVFGREFVRLVRFILLFSFFIICMVLFELFL